MTGVDPVSLSDVVSDEVAQAILYVWPGAEVRPNMNSKGNQRRMFRYPMWDVTYRDRYVGTIFGKTFDVAVIGPQVLADRIPGAFADGPFVRLPGSRARRPDPD